MKKIILVCILLATSVSFAGNEQKLGTTAGLGFAGGWSSGNGFAYRQHFDNGFGVQLAGGAVGFPGGAGANLGVQLMRTLSIDEAIRFYGFLGASATYVGDNSYRFDRFEGWQHQVLPVFGAGIGIEFKIVEHVGVSLELPIAVTTYYTNGNYSFVSALPIPNVSLVYYL